MDCGTTQDGSTKSTTTSFQHLPNILEHSLQSLEVVVKYKGHASPSPEHPISVRTHINYTPGIGKIVPRNITLLVGEKLCRVNNYTPGIEKIVPRNYTPGRGKIVPRNLN